MLVDIEKWFTGVKLPNKMWKLKISIGLWVYRSYFYRFSGVKLNNGKIIYMRHCGHLFFIKLWSSIIFKVKA